MTIIDSRQQNLSLAIRNSLFSFISLTCRLFGSSLIFIIIANLPNVGVNEFGQITYAMALSGIFIIFSEFGFNPLLIRDIAADQSRLHSYTRSVFSLRLLLTIIGFSLLYFYLSFASITSQGRLICIIIAIAFYLSSLSTDFQAIFQSQEKMYLELFCIAVENISILIMILLSFLFKPNIVEIAFIFLIAKSIAFIINYLICGRFVLWVYPIINIQLWKKLLWEAFPFALAGIITTGIVQIDTVLLRELSVSDPESNVGLYQAAMRLFLVPMLLPQIVLKVFLPQMSRMHGQSGPGLVRNLSQVNHILFTIGLLVGLVTFFRGSDLIQLLYGNKLISAGPLLQILGITIMMRFGAAYNLYFTIRNRVWFRVCSGLVGLAAVIFFNVLFIPKFGAMGVAYASILSHIIYWIPWFIAMYKSEGNILLGWRVSSAITAGVILIAVLYVTSRIPLLYMLPVYTIIVFTLTFYTMSLSERSMILSRYINRGALQNAK